MIILYGKLRTQFGKIIGAKVNSVQELVKAAEANRPGFAASIERDRGYVIKRGSDFRKAKDIDEAELEMRFAETTWHVLPMPVGYSGAMRVVLGVVIIAVGAVSYLYGGNVFSASMIKFGFAAMKIGTVVALSGVATLLAPSPPTGYGDRDSPDERPSYLFNGPTNRVAAGNPVPLVFGFDVFVGSIFLSGGLEIGEIV
jgi:predicted phage tail protein